MYRCTADANACRTYYEDLSRVDGQYLAWRSIVLSKRGSNWVYLFANTFLDGEEVTLKEYEPNTRGVIRSWMERGL